ncbi:MAG TPA: glycosyltransferase [Candidatus Kapabacteria bacterium]|nr:glycosyltransferase [Candidatus Kapabacteria bacterium]
MKVVIVSHTAVIDVYQDIFREQAKYKDTELTLIIPREYKEGPAVTEGYEGDGTYRVIKLPAVMGKSGRQNGHFYRGLRAVLKRIAPDIIQLDEEPESIVSWQAIRIAKSLPTRPKIIMMSYRNQDMNFHELWGALSYQRYLYSALTRYTLKNIDHMDLSNYEGVDIFRRAGYTFPITVIPGFGVNANEFCKAPPPKEIVEKYNLSGVVIGFVGRLLQMKGIATLLKAVASIKDDYTLFLVGWGPDKDAFAALARELGIESKVRFTGGVPFRDVIQYIRCMNMMVLPSLTTKMWKEQFGRVLAEAMACEVPVIGSSSGEIPAVIGDAGLVFPEGNAEELAKRISYLMENADRRRAIGAQCRQRVLDNFSNAKLAEKFHELYMGIMSAEL